MRQRLDGGICRSTRITKGQGYSDASHHRRNCRQRPDGAVRGQVLAVQYAEVLGHLFILTHGIGDASSRVHARERCANQRQEHCERLDQHEDFAMARTEDGIAHHDHHVADRRRRALRRRQRVPAIQEVVRRKVLEEVAEGPLYQQ